MKFMYIYAEGAGLMRVPIHEVPEFNRGYFGKINHRCIWLRYADIPENLQ